MSVNCFCFSLSFRPAGDLCIWKHTHCCSSTGHAERGYYLSASHALLISLDHCIFDSATTLTDKAYLLFLLSCVVADEKLKNAVSEVCVISLETKSVPRKIRHEESTVIASRLCNLTQKSLCPWSLDPQCVCHAKTLTGTEVRALCSLGDICTTYGGRPVTVEVVEGHVGKRQKAKHPYALAVPPAVGKAWRRNLLV